jgi:hypothetical protein
MNDVIGIFVIALAVFCVGLIWLVCRATAIREAAWRDMIRRRAEDSDRELMFMRPDFDSTVTLPVIEEP